MARVTTSAMRAALAAKKFPIGDDHTPCTGYFDGCECLLCLENEEQLVTYNLDKQPYERLDQGDKRWAPVHRHTTNRIFRRYKMDVDETYAKLDAGEEIETVYCRYRRRRGH